MALDQVLNSPHLLRRFSPSPVVLRLLTEAAKPDPDIAVLAETIRTDPALSTSILALANSPYYGQGKKVTDVQRAAVVLGVREILKTAFLYSLRKDADANLADSGYSADADWRLSVWSAVAAELIARRLCPDQADLAYLCALLKDVALLFLRSAAPELLTRRQGNAPLTALAQGQLRDEEEAWGLDHPSMSRLLLAKWGLPPEVGEGLAAHHDLEGLEGRPPLARAVILATHWAEVELGAGSGPFSAVRFNHRLRSALGLDEAGLEVLREDCLARFRVLLQSLGLSEGQDDEGFFRHSIKAMQEAYFMSMDLLTAEGGVEAVAALIGRHLGLSFDLGEWDLALKAPHGGGYFLFRSEPGGPPTPAAGPEPLSALPWRLRTKGVSLRSGERKWGEFRHRAPTQSEGDAAALALYLRFVGQAYENYCARQAVLEEKAWAFDALPLGAARLSAQGDLVECNRHFSEILGQDSAQLRGKSLEKVLAERLGLYLGAEWQAFLDAPSRESTSRIVCFTDKRAGAPREVCAYLSAHREKGADQGRIHLLLENLRDISQIQLQALRRRDFLERLVGSMRDLVYTVDEAGRITFASQGLGQNPGQDRSEDFFARFQPAETWAGGWGPQLLEQGEVPVVEAVLVQEGGAARPFELVFSKLEKSAGRGQDTLVVARDMTAVRRLEKELKLRAMYDGLTGLHNHAQFRVVLEREVRRSRRTGRNMGLIFFDLDGFKDINDTKGHQAGDAILRLVGEILTREVRQGMDFPCRYGGDEFAVIVTEVEDRELEVVGERLRRAIYEQFAGKVTISAGLTSLGPMDSVDSLLNRADRAAYSAKGTGGDTVVWAK